MTGNREVEPTMWVSGMAAFLNHWFSRYEEARAHLDTEGGFLLPYGTQCFVTCAEAIRERGLDPDDPDWERIGWDWAHPADPAAWERLSARLATAGAAR